jgi:hypothetical protein
MSSRRTLNQTEGSTNPATKFLQWKSNDKVFAYWDKVKSENVQIKLPFKFQFLEHFHTVKGWNDASESGIYSNEVKFISKEPLKVRAFKGGDIAEGLYSDIRPKIRDAGGKYFRSVYVISEDGEIINLQFKGAVVSAYSDFMNEHENKIEGSWIEINKAEDKKKGATKYSVPIFEVGKQFTQSEMDLADEKYKDIVNYFDKYTSKQEDVEEDEIDDGDVEF